MQCTLLRAIQAGTPVALGGNGRDGGRDGERRVSEEREKARKNIARIERDQRLMNFMKRFVEGSS
jgi:hypothetical protein